MKKIRIVNETGIARGTKIFDGDLEIMPSARRVGISLDIDGSYNMCKVELALVKFDVCALATFHTQDPVTGVLKPVTKIVFEDGSEYQF